MLTFKNQAAQGDLLIRRIKTLPTGLRKAEATNGQFVVAHSETGHNHVIEAKPHVSLLVSDDPMVSYLEVIEATDAAEVVLEHMRNFDTHQPILIEQGIYEIRRQREYTPEGWRKVED